MTYVALQGQRKRSGKSARARAGSLVLALTLALSASGCYSSSGSGTTSKNTPAAATVTPSPNASPIPSPPANPPTYPAVVFPPAAAPRPQNSLDTTDPNVLLPAKSVLLPDGAATTDEIYSTLDLAEMSQRYLDGITNILLPEFPYFHVPPGMVNMHGTPTSQFAGGAPNWGKSIQAMVMARRISGYDLDDARGTLTRQLASTRNMIDVNVGRNLIGRGEGAWIVITGARPENQMTTAAEALIELYKQYPSPDLRQLIQQMITYHTTMATSYSENGISMLHYRVPPPGENPYIPNSIGTIGLGDSPFTVGKTMRTLGSWDALVGDVTAFNSNMLLSNYLQHYSNGLFWTVPPNYPGGAGPVKFAGHIHMYASAFMGFLWEAEMRLRRDPQDARARTLIEFARQGYLFIRNLHDQSAAALGNFGEICATADMLRIAVKLTELGAGDYNEDIERWTRNQIAESQIKGAITIVANPGDPLRDRIGQKVIGLFFEDATHALSIPDSPNDQGSLTLQLVACGLGNVMHAIYDIWNHIVEYKGNIAQVNLLMNRATWQLDVKSEIPYRGSVHVVTRTELGGIDTIEMRIPDGTNPAQVRVLANGAPVSFQWVRTNFVRVTGVRASTDYNVLFPLVSRQLVIRQWRNQEQNWAESSYSPASLNGQDWAFHSFEPQNTFLGTFRGNTLVAVDRRPSGGIALYQHPDMNSLAALGAADSPQPTPTHPGPRFRLKPNAVH